MDLSRKSSNAGKRLLICIGCRVMLTRNLWDNVGLVNGAQGTVYDISWGGGADVLNDPPEVIMVAFDNYTEPPVSNAWWSGAPQRGEVCGSRA